MLDYAEELMLAFWPQLRGKTVRLKNWSQWDYQPINLTRSTSCNCFYQSDVHEFKALVTRNNDRVTGGTNKGYGKSKRRTAMKTGPM